MSDEACAHRDDAAAWALNALDDHEVVAFRTHLEGCAECRAEATKLAEVTAHLGGAVELVSPPSSLKARIMADVQREAALLAAAGPEADRPPAPAAATSERSARRERRWSWLPRPALVGALGAALLALGVVAGTQLGGGDDGAGTVAQASVRTLPATVSGAATARVELTSDAAATFDLHGLAAPPRGQVYQVWLQRPDGSVRPSHTLFTVPRDGATRVKVAEPISGVKALLVTNEPSGGSAQPTGDVAITAPLS